MKRDTPAGRAVFRTDRMFALDVIRMGTPGDETVHLYRDPRQSKEEMMIWIRRLIGRSFAAAGALGAAAAIALAPQPGLANHLAYDDHSTKAEISTVELAPSAACVAAWDAFKAALKADVAEDSSERDLAKTGNDANDPTEDTAERAGLKPLRAAVVTACDPQEATEKATGTAPTAACTSAKDALKAFISSFRAEEKAEAAGGTEGTDADRSEDAAQITQLKNLFQAAATACGFGQSTQTHDFNRSDSGWESGWSNYNRH